MPNPDITLLALFCEKEKFLKYKKLVSKEAIALSETAQIMSDLEAYYSTFPSDDKVDFDKFNTYVSIVRHSGWKTEKRDAYSAIIARVMEQASKDPDPSIVDVFNRIEAASQIIEVCNDVIQGRQETLDPVVSIVEKTKRDTIVTSNIDDLFGPTDLTKILETRIRSGGIEWRLDSFNTAVGPLHQGDFVVMVARPEAGKTSWLCSELTHMVNYIDKDKEAVIFNPEEGGGRLFLRLISSAIDEDIITIASDEATSRKKYEDAVGKMDRIKVVEPAGGISTKDIEKVLDRGNYGIVAINVLDKIKFPYSHRAHQEKEVDRYRSLAYWIRETANRYQVPILAVVQADAAAEGTKWMTQSMIYGSKTGVQGEVDLLLGMGYDPSIDSRRYISILKNKLPGGPKTNPVLKHAKIEVGFNPITGRYHDI